MIKKNKNKTQTHRTRTEGHAKVWQTVWHKFKGRTISFPMSTDK